MAAASSSSSSFTFKSSKSRRKGGAPSSAIPTDVLAKNQEEITRWLLEKDKSSKIVLKDAMNRNVIFVGKCRSGKSTALEIMKTPLVFVKLGSVFAETIEPKIHHFTVEVEGDGGAKANFNIGVIDSPGLFELKEASAGSSARDIATLEELIMKCMSAEITKIHAIFFVVAYNGTVNQEDVESLKRFIALFRGAEQHIHVLITKAEALTDADKDKIEREFRNAPGFSEMLKKVGAIQFTGAVPQSMFDHGFVDPIKHQFDNVEAMREELFETIFGCDAPFELNAIGMTDSVRDKADALFRDLVAAKASVSSSTVAANPSVFKEGCRRLSGWLPVVAPAEREKMNAFLAEAEEYLEGLLTPSPVPVVANA